MNNNNNNNPTQTPLQTQIPSLESFDTPTDQASRSPSPGVFFRKKGKNFLNKEDDQLAKSWLKVAQDPVLGTKRTSPEFWDRLRFLFVTALPESEARTANSLHIRWRSLEKAVDRFCDCVSSVRARNDSGKNWVDEINDASKLYRDLYGTEFTQLSCWTILRQEPKWQESMLQKKRPKKRTRVAVGGEEEDDGGEGNASPLLMTPEPAASERREPKRQALLETTESIETSLRIIAESLAKLAKETERKNRIMEASMTKTLDEQIMARPILGLYPHQRQYYELQQRRILNEFLKSIGKEPQDVPITNSSESIDINSTQEHF